MEVKYSHVKGKTGSAVIGKVSLVAGDNRAGKSALFAALQSCLSGRVDIVGSANAKLGELVGLGAFCATAGVKVDSLGIAADCTITNGKSTSVERSVSVNGIAADKKGFAEAYFGKVPQTVPDLMALSGEELWGLMIPSGDSSNPPAEVNRTIEYLKSINKSDMAAPIEAAMKSGDAGIMSTAGLDAVKQAICAAKKEIDNAEVKMGDDTPIYEGPPIETVKASLDARREQIEAHTSAIQKERKTKDLIATLSEEIGSHKARIQELTRLGKEEVQKLNACAEVIKKLEEIDGMESEGAIDESHWEATKKMLIDISHSLTIIDGISAIEFAESVSTLDGIVSRILSRFSKSARVLAAQKIESNVKQIIGDDSPFATALSIAGNTKSVLQAVKNRWERHSNKIESYRNDVRSVMMKVETCEKALSEAQAMSFALLSEEQLTEAMNEKDAMQAYLKLYQDAEAHASKLLELQTKVEAMKGVKSVLEACSNAIKAWRKDVIEVSIDDIIARANAFLKLVGVPGLKIELTCGKRSSVTITDSLGKNLIAMAGSERVIYGLAILIALQSFHSIRLPIIYAEAAELDSKMLANVLEAAENCRKDGYFIVAHWAEPKRRVHGVTEVVV